MNNKRKLGFTLLELTVVIAMTGIIATIMIASFRTGEKSKRVQLTADGIVNLMRLAQEYSLGGRQIPSGAVPAAGTRCTNDNSITSYSVRIDQSATVASLHGYDRCGARFLLENFSFPQGVRVKQNVMIITECNPSCTTTNNNQTIEVSFSPPFGTIKASKNGNSTIFRLGQADITVESVDGVRTRVIRVDGVSGRVGVLQIPG